MIAAGCSLVGGPAWEPMDLADMPSEAAAVRVQPAWTGSTEAPRLVISMDPVSHRHSVIEGVPAAEWSPLDLHPIAEMRSCIGLERHCRPGGEWRPFVLAESHALPTEFSGIVWIALEFRQADGTPVPAFYTPGEMYELLRLPLNLSQPAGVGPHENVVGLFAADATLLMGIGVIA